MEQDKDFYLNNYEKIYIILSSMYTECTAAQKIYCFRNGIIKTMEIYWLRC